MIVYRVNSIFRFYGLLDFPLLTSARVMPPFFLKFFCQDLVFALLLFAGAVLPLRAGYAQQAPAASEPQFEEVLKKIEESDSEVPSLPPQTAVEPPPQTPLANPAAVAPAPANIGATISAVNEALVTDQGDVPAVPALPAAPPAADDLFFDAESLAPGQSTGVDGAPRSVVRTVNPQTEPASKFVIVKKNHEPGSRQAQLVSAQRAMMLGRYDSALALYDALYEKNKRDEAVLMGRAAALQHLGQEEAAIRAYEELLEIKPNNVEAQVNMLGLVGARYPAVALQRLDALRQAQPNNVVLIGQMGVLQAKLGYYEEAMQYLGMAASMEPKNANHYYNMAVISDRAGRKKEAVRYYEKTLEIDSIYSAGSTIPRDSVFDRLAKLR